MNPKIWQKIIGEEAHYEIFNDICDVLERAHFEDGVSLEDLAADCEVTPQTIRNWINRDIMFPHFRTVMKVLRGMQLKIVLVPVGGPMVTDKRKQSHLRVVQ